MDGTISGVQAPKVPQPHPRMTSISELTKVTRDGDKAHFETSGAVQGKSRPSSTGVTEQGAIAPLEQSLPLAILQNPKLVQAEWAWRRLLTEVIQQGTVRDPSSPEAAMSGEQNGDAGIASAAIQVLWDAMSKVAERTPDLEHKSDAVSVPASLLQNAPVRTISSDGGTLLSFHALQSEHVDKSASDVVRSLVLEDRWVNVTRTPDAPLFGSGLWVPSALQPGEGSTIGVRWKAERHTKPGPQGEPVHRLRLVVPYDGQPVSLQFVCMYPSVSVHIRTDHEALQQRLRQSSSRVAEALSAIGWRVDQWSVGDWEGESF